MQSIDNSSASTRSLHYTDRMRIRPRIISTKNESFRTPPPLLSRDSTITPTPSHQNLKCDERQSQSSSDPIPITYSYHCEAIEMEQRFKYDQATLNMYHRIMTNRERQVLSFDSDINNNIQMSDLPCLPDLSQDAQYSAMSPGMDRPSSPCMVSMFSMDDL